MSYLHASGNTHASKKLKLGKKIKIYGTAMCPFCDAAKELLNNKKIDFKFINLDKDPDLRDKMAKDLSYYTVPMIFIEEKFIGGFTELQKIQSSLG